MKNSNVKSNAEFIGKLIADNRTWSFKELKSASSFSDMELALALGWLMHQNHILLKEENEALRNFRLLLAKQCGEAIKNAMGMLGIEMPERM